MCSCSHAMLVLRANHSLYDCHLSLQGSSKLVIAFEPVWAIGTGLTASPAVVQTVHTFIRDWLQTRFPGNRSANEHLLYAWQCVLMALSSSYKASKRVLKVFCACYFNAVRDAIWISRCSRWHQSALWRLCHPSDRYRSHDHLQVRICRNICSVSLNVMLLGASACATSSAWTIEDWSPSHLSAMRPHLTSCVVSVSLYAS